MREWFAGMALANPEIMKDVPEQDRIDVAIAHADRLVAALAVQRQPIINVPLYGTITRDKPTVPEMPAAKRATVGPGSRNASRTHIDTCLEETTLDDEDIPAANGGR